MPLKPLSPGTQSASISSTIHAHDTFNTAWVRIIVPVVAASEQAYHSERDPHCVSWVTSRSLVKVNPQPTTEEGPRAVPALSLSLKVASRISLPGDGVRVPVA